MKRHWYFITIHECPVCHSRKEYRKRRYGRRPSYRKRYDYDGNYYDYCLEYEYDL